MIEAVRSSEPPSISTRLRRETSQMTTIFEIFCIRQIPEIRWEYSGTVRQLFIDFKMAYD
jgi:hypothetical protein